MLLIRTIRCMVFAAFSLSAGCTVPPPDEQEPSPDLDKVVIGQEFPKAVVSLCVTREQAETVLKTQRDHGPEAALKAFEEQHCFMALVYRLRPLALVSSEKLAGRTVSLVEVSVPTSGRRHVLYMITLNPVVVGTEA